jgi:hypothetical protein
MNDLLCGGERGLIAEQELRALASIHCPGFATQLVNTTRRQRAALLKMLRVIDRDAEPPSVITRADYWKHKTDFAEYERESAAWKVVAARIQLHRARAAYLNLIEW